MKLSVVTICRNSEKSIERTIFSVANQIDCNPEYIIVDGGSTDSTVDIIRKHEKHVSKWISEPDDGIAHAMNKGLDMVTGDFILFLHSDDYLASNNSLSLALDLLASDFDIFMFDIFLSDDRNQKQFSPRGFSWWMNFKTGVYHQSAICRRELFSKIGAFDTGFSVAMDYDFFLRAYRADVKTKKCDLALSVMSLSGTSSRMDWPSVKNRLIEERKTHLKNTSSKAMRSVYRLYWLLYPVYKYIKTRL